MTCRRRFLQCTALLGAGPGALLGARAATLPELRLSGPPASVSNPLIHLAAQGRVPGLAERVRYLPWRDPDQLRALALRGEADRRHATNRRQPVQGRAAEAGQRRCGASPSWSRAMNAGRCRLPRRHAVSRGHADLVFRNGAGPGVEKKDFRLRYVARRWTP